MNEVVKIIEHSVSDFLEDKVKYPDSGFGKLREFINRFYDLESEIDDEEDCVKKMFLQTEFEKMEACTKVFRGNHVLFALRSGLNVHAEFHLFPSPVMHVCFEETNQKREKSIVQLAYFQDEWYVLDGQSYVITSWVGNFSCYKEYSNVMDMTKYPNYVFDEDTLKASGVEVPKAFHVKFKVGERKLISLVDKPMDVLDCFSHQQLVDHSDFIEEWFNRFFVFWYIRSFFRFRAL